MKFICDGMFGRLARWLRLAGYDTTLASASLKTKAKVQLALEEERYFLTRNFKALEIKGAAQKTLILEGNDTQEHIRILTQQLSLNWTLKPFTRCVYCNALLQLATEEESKKAPAKIRFRIENIETCPSCKRLFWQDRHTAKMLDYLTDISVRP